MIQIERFKENPLIVPDPNINWMSKNAFNPGVVYCKEDGIYRMLIRGAWTENTAGSDLGLALSVDGIQWNVLKDPVLKCGSNDHCGLGIEDPRIVEWQGWFYIFATACDLHGGRVGIWRTKNWLKWEWLGIMADIEDKDACIIPKKIDDSVFMLHRRHPNITISRTNNETLINAQWEKTVVLSSPDDWYEMEGKKPHRIGIGGQPIWTPKGWLVLTHCVHDIGRWGRMYSLGFMLLDLNDPTRIEYIHPDPILVPETVEELNGRVPVVCFSNATVDAGGSYIYVYWGASDTCICGGRLKKSSLKMCYENNVR